MDVILGDWLALEGRLLDEVTLLDIKVYVYTAYLRVELYYTT